MNTGKISARYTSALYSIAKEKGETESVYSQMHALSEAFFKTEGLSVAMSNPMYTDEQKTNLLKTAIGNGLTDTMKTFIHFVAEKERLEFMPFMAMMYQEIYRKDNDIILGKVTTANQMGKETLDNLRNKIEQKTGKRVILHDEQNEDLIGGFILELNNLRYDASIKTSLDQIKNKLTGR